LLLSAIGGAFGLALAWGALRLVVWFGPTNLPRLSEIRLDAVALMFTLVLSGVTALTFGAIPLWRGDSLPASLHESGRGNTFSRRRHRARHLLMAAQIALAMVLLVASGLMLRSFQKLRAVDPGFNADSTLTFSIGLPVREYPTLDQVVAGHHTIIDALAGLPGVTEVAGTTCLPLSGGCSGNTVRVEGRAYRPSQLAPAIALFRAVTGGYFDTIDIRIMRGRGIDRGDVDRRERVVVVNETFVQRFFPDEDPIGRRVASNRPPPKPGAPADLTWLTIVGVVANTPIRTLTEAPVPQLFMPLSLANGPEIPRALAIGPEASVVSYVVHTATPPLDLFPSARRAIGALNPNLAIAQVDTLENSLNRASAQMAFTMVLLAIASVIALTLGVVGIYGVTSYIVSQRTNEIGVRLALGAEPASVSAQLVRQGGVVAAVGIAVGLAAAFAGGRLIESLLYTVSPRDPSVFALTTVALLAVALLACWLPARRAARLNPIDALRIE
jgi:predicted permease